jgi:hypothetical protein
MAKGLRPSSGAPPMVPLIPDIDAINVIIINKIYTIIFLKNNQERYFMIIKRLNGAQMLR